LTSNRSHDATDQAHTVTVRHRLEFAFVWTVLNAVGILPRRLARAVGAALGAIAFHSLSRLRSVGLRNLSLAYPQWDERQRHDTLRGLYRSLGHQLAEFCLMSRYSLARASRFIRYDGLENYLGAVARGKGVLVLTGHLGAWELSSFYHSLAGYPMGMVIRRLDNPLVDAFVNRIRCLHGNRVIHKDDFARGLISSMRAGETVGILMDTNMTPPQGIFVPYFGIPACTPSGLARIALKTGAAVVPGFLLADAEPGRYTLRFGAPLQLIETGDADADILANTALFTSVIEGYVRLYPEQWLWMHRRWKTRPAGEPALY